MKKTIGFFSVLLLCFMATFPAFAQSNRAIDLLLEQKQATLGNAAYLVLVAAEAPPLQNGLFFYGPEETVAFLGNGVLCVGGPLFRLPIVKTDPLGVATHALDVTDPPGPAGQITAGSTWYFQFWYRDPPGGGAFFNLSDGLGATFCP